MKFLLDSCAFIDIAINVPNLSKKAIAVFENVENEICLSVASVWELGLKKSLGKLDFDIKAAVDLANDNAIQILNIDLPISLLVNELPYYHKDPFDRIIIATAKINDAQIITSDGIFKKYGLKTIQSR